ncbi:MAG: SEC-C domain-containing protein [Candidatus Aenigmarchaeota archaeon]|nr:SEC-C domain-containing protein [Candidatus Aenigmarchaeota archaeon]
MAKEKEIVPCACGSGKDYKNCCGAPANKK